MKKASRRGRDPFDKLRAAPGTGFVEIYDTTLRDGRQGEGVNFAVEDKIRVTRILDDLGLHFIEGGWPGANPVDVEFFNRMKGRKLKNARLAAFGMTARVGLPPGQDPLLGRLVAAKAPVITVFGKSWDLHVKQVLGTDQDANLRTIEETCRYLKSRCDLLIYDAEHFFDGYKSDRGYALRTLEAAATGGAQRLVLCDTNGGSLPHDVGAAVAEAAGRLGTPLGIHCHNDTDCATANSLEAVRSGAVHVQGTINGYGERCGNGNLCAIVPDLELKMGLKALGRERLKGLTFAARMVSDIANQKPPGNAAFVGLSAFTHKAGVHVNAMMKSLRTYEHVSPEDVGNSRRYLISDQAGASNVQDKALKLGIKLDRKSPEARHIVEQVHKMEAAGYTFEAAEGSFELMLRRSMGTYRPHFHVHGFHVTVEGQDSGKAQSEATVRVEVEGKKNHTVADGIGPVDALDKALRKALDPFYPRLREAHLSDFKVRILDSREGSGAKVRVLVETRDGRDSWTTVGVSDNIIEASWEALVDALEYKLQKAENQNGKAFRFRSKSRSRGKRSL